MRKPAKFSVVFEKFFNNVRPIDESALEDITQCKVLHEHGIITLLIEVNNTMKKMANCKAAVDKKIPLEAYKYLTGDNFDSVYTIIDDFWNDTHNPDEFHVAKLCIFPKKGNLRLWKNYWVYASSMLPRKLSACLSLISANQSSNNMV